LGCREAGFLFCIVGRVSRNSRLLNRLHRDDLTPPARNSQTILVFLASWILVEHELKGLAFRPLTSVNWPDLERLFGKRGACGGCWCMYWRLTQSQFRKQKGEGNRRALRSIVATGEVPGLLAYADGEAANVLLSPGDVLLLYTDGLTEATDSSGEEFGPARLADYVQARTNLNPEALLRDLRRFLHEFAGGKSFPDDLTIVLGKSMRTSSARSVTH
jgi:hypothetical protein